MTAPAVTESAPVETVDSVLSDILTSTVTETVTEHAPEEIKRDEKGRFLPKDGQSDEDAAMVTDAVDAVNPAEVLGDTSTATDGETEPPPVVLPDGFVAIPKIERELATQFTVMDKDGELEPPDFLVKFPANGKERLEPFDKVVKLAQMGVYNQERDQQMQATKVEAQRIAQHNQTLQQQLEQTQREIEALLSDDNAYLTKRAQYERENTPEMRLQRQQEQLHEQEARMQFTQVAAEGSRFFDTSIAPAVEQITKALPTVSAEEIGAKVLLVTSRFQVHTPFGSIVPPSHYDAVKDAIVSDVLPWAQQVHESRDHDRQTAAQQIAAERKAAQAAAEKAKADAQADAQRTKNQLTRTARPTQGKAKADNPPPRVIRTMDDAMDDIKDSAVKAALGG